MIPVAAFGAIASAVGQVAQADASVKIAQAPTPGLAGPSGGGLGNKVDNDFSGWTVSTGRSRASGATIDKTSSDAVGTSWPQGQSTAGTVAAALDSPVVWVVGGVLALAIVARAMRGRK